MDAQKYLKIAIICVIVLVLFVVGYGFYINGASRSHIKKIEDARYTLLPVAYAKYRNIHSRVENLSVYALSYWTVDVTAQYDGVISKVNFRASQHVKKGDVLAVMTNSDLLASRASAEANIEETRAKLVNAEQIVNRYEYLVNNNAIAVQEYDSAVAQREAYRAKMDHDIAYRDLVKSQEEKMIIRAPQDSLIIQNYYDQGKFVRAGDVIFMLSDIKSLRLEVTMTKEQLADLINVDNNFILEVPSYSLTNKAYPFAEVIQDTNMPLNMFKIKLEKTVPDMSVETDYYKTYWYLDNPAGILDPTYYPKSIITSEKTARALVVPKDGVHYVENSNSWYIYTLNEQQELVRRDVSLGIQGDKLVEITDGVEEGDPVVIANPVDYTVGMKVGVKEYEF